jgi:hypothetical protein
MNLQAVRSGPWKLHLPGANPPAAPKKGEKKKAVTANAGGPQLYNLETDIGEANNVAAQNPDVVKRLTALADAVKNDLGTEGSGPGVRKLGRVSNPQPFILPDGTVRADAVGKQKRFE